MIETPWFCPNCGHQNQPTSGYCPQCGTAFPSGHAYAPATQKKNGALKYVAIGCLGMAGLAFALIVAGVLLSKPSDKEITVEMMPVLPPPGEGRASSGVARLEQMPEFSEIAAAARDLGFRVKSFGDGQPSADSMTGRAFMATSEQMINGQRFQIVVMGPSSERVDTVRLQAFGIQTKAARQVLQKQAENILDALDRGQLPESFVQQFYAGQQIGDGGVFNGFCNVSVLQRPLNPNKPSSDDRISLDLLFDKEAER